MDAALRSRNFSAGPSALPEPVLFRIRDELFNWRNTGASVMEVSHRSAEFMEMAAEMEQDLRDLLIIPSNYQVLFLHGGAAQQFSQVPMNLAGKGGVCNYIDTGHWAHKAIVAAKKYSQVNIASTVNYDMTVKSIPREKDWLLSDNPAYLHYTANETIDGLEFHWVPNVGGEIPLVGDFSASILSGPIDVSRFGLIYAGAQKNIGPSGMTLVIVREDLFDRTSVHCPDIFNYQVQAKHGSMYNTPATFPWYAASLVFRWIKSIGGLEVMQAKNVRKKDILYRQIDSSDFYINDVSPPDRSVMNIPFRLPTLRLEEAFLAGAAELGFIGLKGHRDKGGIRASIYNAVSEETVQSLADYMEDFESRLG